MSGSRSPVAAIDCGTNTIRLLIATQAPDNTFAELAREQRFVGLGQGVDATGCFTDDAVIRTFAACEEYAALIAQHRVGKVRFVATSATRDATNRDEFLAGIEQRLGVTPEVIPGEEEAGLSFRGALSGLHKATAPILVIDSGGGSTELVCGLANGSITNAISLNMGSRRIRERYLIDDPPTESQIHAARAEVRRLLGTIDIDLDEVGTAVAVAGTITTMSALAQHLTTYDHTKVHLSRLNRGDIADLTEVLLASSSAEIAAMGPVQPERAKVLASGALIINEIAKRVGSATLIVSETDILDGIALTLMH